MSSGKVTLLHNKAAPRDRFAFSKALLGWCCSCSIGQCALIPLLSCSGSRRSVSYRSYRKRSEKLEVFLEGWVTSSHLTSFFSVHPHGSNLRCFKTEVVWVAIWWGTFRTASHSQRAPFHPAWHVWQGIDPHSAWPFCKHDFSWPKNTDWCWLWCCNLPPLLTASNSKRIIPCRHARTSMNIYRPLTNHPLWLAWSCRRRGSKEWLGVPRGRDMRNHEGILKVLRGREWGSRV